MASKVVVVGHEDHGQPARAPEKAWRVVGWFGLLLVVVGLTEILLLWFDPAASPGREYQRISASLGSLPLPSVGMGLLVASALARARRTLLLTTGFAAILFGSAILATYFFFLSAVPAVLSGITLAATAEVKSVVLRGTLIGVGSSLAHLAAGVFALRHVLGSVPEW